MNVFSQSVSRAEADSGDDSELSLSIFENEPFSFGQDQNFWSKSIPKVQVQQDHPFE